MGRRRRGPFPGVVDATGRDPRAGELEGRARRTRFGWAGGFDDVDPDVLQAADDYARGRPVKLAPPSLRVYALAKDVPGLVQLNALEEPWELWRELEAYGAAIAAEQARRNKQAEQARRQKGRRR